MAAASLTLNLRLSPSSQDTPLLCAFTHYRIGEEGGGGVTLGNITAAGNKKRKVAPWLWL